MNEKKREKQEKNLLELGLMETGDKLVDFFQTSYVDKVLPGFGQWKQGWGYFTEERFICMTGFLTDNIVVPYGSIKKLEKCSQFFFPMGIAITYDDPVKGKEVKCKVSMMKRDKWIDFMSKKAKLY